MFWLSSELRIILSRHSNPTKYTYSMNRLNILLEVKNKIFLYINSVLRMLLSSRYIWLSPHVANDNKVGQFWYRSMNWELLPWCKTTDKSTGTGKPRQPELRRRWSAVWLFPLGLGWLGMPRKAPVQTAECSSGIVRFADGERSTMAEKLLWRVMIQRPRFKSD